MKIRKIILFIVIFTVFLSVFSATSIAENSPEWPFFHFNLRHSGKVSYSTANNNGMLLWKTQLGGKVDIASPVIGADGTIYIGSTDHYLYAVGKDGKIKWQYEAHGTIHSTPAVSGDGTVCFSAEDGRLYFLNKNGTLRWETKPLNITSSSPVILPDGTIIVGAHNNYIYAFSKNGTVKWKYKPATSGIISSPAVGPDGTIYVTSLDHHIYAFTKHGSLKWKFLSGYMISSSPAVSLDGTIYFGCRDYYLYALTPNALLKWKFKTSGVIDYSTPAIDEARNTVYIGSRDGYLYAIKTDGTIEWKFKTDGPIYSSPVVSAEGTIFIGSKDGYLYAVNPDGSLKWKFKADKEITSSPAIGKDGVVYIATTGGYLYAIGKRSEKGKIEIVMYPGNPYMTVNGVKKEIDPGRGTKPVIIPKWGRTVVPIRAIVEALGGTIEWDGVARKVTIKFNGNIIELWIDNPEARVNGKGKWIDENNHDVRPIIVNDRTMLPLRFVVENLGCRVEWEPKTRKITIIYIP